jgi:hypothetical protein
MVARLCEALGRFDLMINAPTMSDDRHITTPSLTIGDFRRDAAAA